MSFAWFLYYIFLLLCNWHAQMWNLKAEDRKNKRENNMKKRVTGGEKYEVQDSKWWTTEEFEETEGKGEKLANLKLCWNLWRHSNRNIYTSPSFHMSKNHHHFIALDHFYVFMTCTWHAHDTTFHKHIVLGLNWSSPYKIPHKHTVLRIWWRLQGTGNKTSSYQFSCNIVCDQ